MKQFKDYGFIKPEVTKDDYVMGDGRLGARYGEEVLCADGQWEAFLPTFEKQNQHGFESMSCWVYGTLNCLETLEKRKYGKENNYAERYIVVLGYGSPQGGSPQNAAEAIRKYGVIPQDKLDWTPDINQWWEWAKPNPMTKEYLDIGAKWLTGNTYAHDWVSLLGAQAWWKKIWGKSNQDIMCEALKSSPLGVSVLAWQFRNGLAYKNSWQRDNHWLMCYGYVYGKYWLLYDHYDNMFVRAEWQYPFGFIKRYRLNKSNNTTNMKTVKKKDEADIYVVSNTTSELTKIEAFNSYKFMLDSGWVTPYEVLDDLSEYIITENSIGVLD